MHAHKLKISERRENYTIFLLFIVGIPPHSAMEPHNQGSLGTRWRGAGGQRYEVGTWESRSDGPMLGLVGKANQKRRRVQRDKKMVWERFWCVCAAWACVWCWWAQQSRG